MADWSIDWVSIRQQHPPQTPMLGGSEHLLVIDSETGQVTRERVGFFSHEGSFDTRVAVRSYQGMVEWSGNPSRWGRLDNVFGYSRMVDCLALINRHLEALGLPPFTTSARVANARRVQMEAPNGAPITTGAVLTRVDLNRNFFAGDMRSAMTYLRAAASAVYRGKSADVHSPTSMSWGNVQHSRLSMYAKGAEIAGHTNYQPSRVLNQPPEVAQAYLAGLEYRRDLGAWCDSVGLVRHECRFGRHGLRQSGLRSLDEWNDERACDLAQTRFDAMNVGCSTGLDRAFEALSAAGLTDRRAAVLSGVVSRWYMGDDTRTGVSPATWYRYRTTIRDVLGLDIAQRPDVAVLSAQVRTVTLTPATPPAWYRYAA